MDRIELAESYVSSPTELANKSSQLDLVEFSENESELGAPDSTGTEDPADGSVADARPKEEDVTPKQRPVLPRLDLDTPALEFWEGKLLDPTSEAGAQSGKRKQRPDEVQLCMLKSSLAIKTLTASTNWLFVMAF